MKTMGTTVMKAVGMLAILAMIPANGFAFGNHRSGGHRQGPPQEAIDACAEMSEGDLVQFTAPCGDTVQGICRQIRGQLIAVPEGGPPEGRRGRGQGRHIARMARALDLTEAQQEQVKAILEAERERIAPVRQQLAETRERIRQAAQAEPFDEAAIRALAASQNDARIELIVSRARVKSEIHALLTPEQQELAKKFRSGGKGRHGHRPWM